MSPASKVGNLYSAPDWASGTLGPEQNERETPPVTLIHILFSLRVKKKRKKERKKRGGEGDTEETREWRAVGWWTMER